MDVLYAYVLFIFHSNLFNVIVSFSFLTEKQLANKLQPIRRKDLILLAWYQEGFKFTHLQMESSLFQILMKGFQTNQKKVRAILKILDFQETFYVAIRLK